MRNPEPPRKAFLALWLFMVALLQLRPLSDVDVFWQLRLGQMMLDQGQLITVEPFSYTRPGEPAPTVGWLSEVIYAVLDRLGSWRAVQTGHVLVFAGAFALAGAIVRARLICVAAAVLLGFLVSLPHSAVRTQGFALGCYALLMVISTREWPGWKKVLAALPVLLLWPNVHPSVLTAAFWLAPLAAAKWLRWWREREPAPWDLTLLLILTGLAQLATPMGWTIFETQRTNLEISRTLGISEWLPSWAPVPGVGLFWAALAVSLVLLVRLRFRVRLEDLGVFLLFTVLTLSAARFALFWSLSMVPVWTRWLEQALPAELFAQQEERKQPVWLWPGVLALEVAAVVLLLVRGPAFDREIPLAGVAALKQVLRAGRIYNYREWAGPLILEGSPEWRVAIDGRLYLYDLPTWQQYNAAAAGDVPLAELVAVHHPDAFFLRPSFHEGLIPLLRQLPEWKEVYADEYCIVFVRH